MKIKIHENEDSYSGSDEIWIEIRFKSSISFDDDEESTASQEDDLEDWIENLKKNTYNITNLVETHQKFIWRQALRTSSQGQEQWTRKAAEWNPTLLISTMTQRRARRPAKRWESDLKEFVKDEETEATQSNDLKNSNTWLVIAMNIYEWEKKERQYTKHIIDK